VLGAQKIGVVAKEVVMIGKKTLIWAAGFILASYTVVRAQGTATGEQDTDPMKFSVSVIGAYTDNRDSSAIAESTFDFYFQPRIDAVSRWANSSSAVFYYAPAFRFRSDPSIYQNENQLFHDLGLEIRHGLSDLVSVNLSEHFNYTDDPSVQQNGATLRSDASFILNTVSAGLAFQFNPRASLTVSGNNMIKRYSEAEVAKDSDEDSVGGAMSLWGQVSKQVALLAEARITDYSYESSLNLQRGVTTVSVGVGLDSYFSPNFQAGIHGGLQTAEYEDPTLDSASDPYGNLGFVITPVPTTRFKGNLSYALRNSDVYPFASQKITAFTGGLEWDAVPSTLTLSLAGTVQSGEYSADALPGSEALYPTGNRDAVVVTGQAVFKIDTATSVALIQSYEDVSSDVSESFTKNSTSLALSRSF